MNKKAFNEEFCQVLRNLRRLQSATQELTVWDLEAAQEKLAVVVSRRRKEHDIHLEKERERQARIEQFRHMLELEGLSVDDLRKDAEATPAPAKKSTSKVPPKYQVVDENGNVVTWAGRGRKPKAIEKALQQGKTLDDLLIR